MPTYVGLETSGHVLLETSGGLLLETSTVNPPAVGVLAIAFDDPTLEPFPAWTRIDTLAGCRVRSCQIDRGRPTEFDKTDVGTAVLRIVDRQGMFDPTNTTSPYHGKIVPGKQAAVSLENPVNDTWHTLFRGYVESWHYQLGRTREHMELELQLVDGFAILARAELRVGVDGTLPLPAEIAAGNVGYGRTEGFVSDRIESILDDVGWPVELSVMWDAPTSDEIPDIFSGNVKVGPKAYGPGTSALDALWDAADAEFPGVSNMWMGGPGGFDGTNSPRAGHLIFRGRQARFRPDVVQYGIERRTVGDPSAWNETDDPDHEVVPVAELEWSNGNDNLYNACSATPQGILPATGQWRQLDPKKDDIAGQLVKADDPGLTGAEGFDAASIAHYGLRSLTFDNLQTLEGKAGPPFNNSLQETKLFATYYVENYSAAPANRISRMVFKSRRADDPHGPALWQHMCNCEISDLLTLKTEHPGGGGFASQEFYVEGIHYTISPGSPGLPIVELSLDVSPRAHWTSNPFDADEDPA